MFSDDVTRHYHGGAETSSAAWESSKVKADADRKRIYNWIKDTGGATCQECEKRLSIPHETCSARISQLKADGRICWNGQYRKTKSGHNAQVYEVNTREQGRLL